MELTGCRRVYGWFGQFHVQRSHCHVIIHCQRFLFHRATMSPFEPGLAIGAGEPCRPGPVRRSLACVRHRVSRGPGPFHRPHQTPQAPQTSPRPSRFPQTPTPDPPGHGPFRPMLLWLHCVVALASRADTGHENKQKVFEQCTPPRSSRS